MAERQYCTLTKRTVDRLSVNGKDAIFWDRDLPGFGKSDLIFVSFIPIIH